MGFGDAELDVVIDDKVYPIYDQSLPEITDGEAYTLLADGVELGQLEVVGSVASTALNGPSPQGLVCFAWRAIGCCSTGAHQRRLCCRKNYLTDGYF